MSKQVLYIHFGTHKTGTTALQHFFEMNRSVLRRKGYEYPPDAGGEAGQHRLGWSLWKDRGERRRRVPVDMQNAAEEWRMALDSDSPRILLSSETLCKCNRKEIELIREYTSGFQVKCIIYLRRQDLMVSSMYNQVIKASGRTEFDYQRFPSKLRYIDLLEDLAAVFGKENVIVRPYEKQQFYKGSIFADFLHHGLNMELTADFEAHQRDVNSRLHRVVLEYKRMVNFLAMTLEQKISTLGPLLEVSSRFYEEQRADYPLLSPEQRILTIQEYDQTNQQIARDYLGRADGRLFYDPLPDPKGDWQPYETLAEEDALFINRYLMEKHPNTLCNIIRGILDSLQNEDSSVQSAVERLLPGIVDDSVKDNSCRAALDDKYAELSRSCKGERSLDWLRQNTPATLKGFVKRLRQSWRMM